MKNLLFFALFMFLFLPIDLKAEDSKQESLSEYKKYTYELMNACSSEAQSHWDTGVTSEMMEGNNIYIQCLKNYIKLLTKDFFRKGEYSQEKFLADVDKGATIYASLISNIMYENKSCVPHCYGSMYPVVIGGKAQSFFQIVIEELVISRMAEGWKLPPLPKYTFSK